MTIPLPRSWYLDRTHFETEMAVIFGRAWLPVTHISALSEPGDYLATRVGGQEIIVVCGEDREVRCFYNVCQHRAHPLLEGYGRLRSSITCPYHAWRYTFSGALQHARYTDKVTGFDAQQFGLTSIASTSFAGFIMVCLDDKVGELPAPLRELETRLLADHPSLPFMREVRRREDVLQANWKTIIENYLECYHCNVAHPSFGQFDLNTWKHLVEDGWSRQGRVAGASDDAHIGQEDLIGLSAWWQWPHIFWARAYDSSSFVVTLHEPLAPERTRQTRITYTTSGFEDDNLKAFTDLFDEVFAEDISLVEKVQRGLASPGYRGGRLIRQREARAGWSEHGVEHFQDWVRRSVEKAR